MRRPYSPRHFVFQDRADDPQPSVSGQLLDLGLQFFPNLDHRQRHLHQQLPVSEDLKLPLGLALHSLIGFPHSGSPFPKKSFPPELYPSSGESRCFPFSGFN